MANVLPIYDNEVEEIIKKVIALIILVSISGINGVAWYMDMACEARGASEPFNQAGVKKDF